jgi:hypothetical protein
MMIRKTREFEDHRPGYRLGEFYRRPQQQQYAIGTPHHPDGDLDVFTGR